MGVVQMQQETKAYTNSMARSLDDVSSQLLALSMALFLAQEKDLCNIIIRRNSSH
jgi:hypothetical protein